ncbi:hypothetical protein F1728_04495 [Gimesia benthica]|uniref:Uncharacterized protein n=1 Tax=Gimesia benthica TaxID=2608982 RepID=A0A6I6A7E2_9PLAN|nr:hypothetical protein [Gimesia benthica]QGQ21996.1 hypothetical protein F1728_04495 [Gimesia benthica]
MPTVDEYLSELRINQPEWVCHQPEFTAETIRRFFSSRVVYYPGACTDGRAIAIFNATKSAYCFVHIDLTTTAQQVSDDLKAGPPQGCNGYTPVVASGISTEIFRRLMRLDMTHPVRDQVPVLKSVFWTILERDQDRADEHGFEYLAFLHIQAEAVWACQNLWSKADVNPFAVVLQDHAWGGNYASFGGEESPLYQAAQRTKYPDLLLVANNTKVWPDYQAVSERTHRVIGQNRLFLSNQTSSQK